MRASAHLEVARRAGADVLVEARSEPPFAVRATPDRILVVGSSAAPVGGDDLRLDVLVGPNARALIGTAAATVVWPGPTDGPDGPDGTGRARSPWSTISNRLVVGPRGHLDWAPEPMVSVIGSRHRTSTTVMLDGSATARIVEEVSLGRSGELSGRLDLELRVERDGAPLVHHTERLGPDVPGWGSVVHVGAARHVLTMVEVGVAPGPVGVAVGAHDGLPDGTAVARLLVAPDVVVTLAIGPDRPTTLRSVCRDLSG